MTKDIMPECSLVTLFLIEYGNAFDIYIYILNGYIGTS